MDKKYIALRYVASLLARNTIDHRGACRKIPTLATNSRQAEAKNVTTADALDILDVYNYFVEILT